MFCLKFIHNPQPSKEFNTTMSNMSSLFFCYMCLLCFLYCGVCLSKKRKDSDCSGCTEDCDIAYAYDSSNPSRNLCLLEFSDNEDWGFSVLNFEFDSFLDSNDEELTLDLYAGATNCDLNNGIIVGEVVLAYSSDLVDTLTIIGTRCLLGSTGLLQS